MVIETRGYNRRIPKYIYWLVLTVFIVLIGLAAPPLLPPVLAIVLAIITRQVVLALFAGILVGGLMVYSRNPFNGTLQALSWITESVTDSWNATILVFDFIIGAFAGVLYVSGAMADVARKLSGRVRSARDASLFSWIMGG